MPNIQVLMHFYCQKRDYCDYLNIHLNYGPEQGTRSTVIQLNEMVHLGFLYTED